MFMYRSLPIRSNSDKSEGVPVLTSERGGGILQLPPESTQLGILGVHYYDARGKARVTYEEQHAGLVLPDIPNQTL
jgi:hypothetical protein